MTTRKQLGSFNTTAKAALLWLVCTGIAMSIMWGLGWKPLTTTGFEAAILFISNSTLGYMFGYHHGANRTLETLDIKKENL
jgi:hypothetical protein